VLYEETWYSMNGVVKRKPKVLEGEYLFLLPPQLDEFSKN